MKPKIKIEESRILKVLALGLSNISGDRIKYLLRQLYGKDDIKFDPALDLDYKRLLKRIEYIAQDVKDKKEIFK